MRKTILIILSIVIILIALFYFNKKYYEPKQRIKIAKQEVAKLENNNTIKDGDIIFQTSLSKQSKAIQLATHSKYSHCGIIFKDSNTYYVYEAVKPVKKTRLDKWIARGENGKYIIKRLINSEKILTSPIVQKMKQIAIENIGKKYDIYFEWSEDKMYCSELVWKIYKNAANIEVGKLQKLKDFDLSNELVKEIMKKRYGKNIPFDELVISPASIFESPNLYNIVPAK